MSGKQCRSWSGAHDFISQCPGFKSNGRWNSIYDHNNYAASLHGFSLLVLKRHKIINESSLTLSMLSKSFSRRHFEIFSLFFPEKGSDISYKLSHRRQYAWNIKAYFLGKKSHQTALCWNCLDSGKGKQFAWNISPFFGKITIIIIKI